MKGLKLHPPWAYLVPDPKLIETRSWSTKHRGWLAIHVGRSWHEDGRRFGRQAVVEKALLRILRETGWSELPLGVIVAVGRIAGVIPTERFRAPSREVPFGDYGPGRYAWVLDGCRRLREPIDCPGKQGLWEVPEEAVARIRAQWRNGDV